MRERLASVLHVAERLKELQTDAHSLVKTV